MDDETGGVRRLPLIIDERPTVVVFDEQANRHFLESVDGHFWAYQAAVHAQGLLAEDLETRNHAAAALRVAFGQGTEALFAHLAAFTQSPRFPIAWLLRYRNADLRSVVHKIHHEQPLPTALTAPPSWRAIADAVFQRLAEPNRSTLTAQYSRFWHRLAGAFLDVDFEPEYNSLKHGMRTIVGGFSIAGGLETTLGLPAPPDQMRPIGGSEFGSTFWSAERVNDSARTYHLSSRVTRAWNPAQFFAALPLIGMSIQNITARARILAGEGADKVQFVWPSDPATFDSAWREQSTVSRLTIGNDVDLTGVPEPTVEEILRSYRS